MLIIFSLSILISSTCVTGVKLLPVTEKTFVSNPIIQIEVINGGRGISAIIRNTGKDNVTEVNWNIQTDGGLIFLGKKSSGIVPRIFPDNSVTINTPLVIGFGRTQIHVTAESSEGASADMVRNARVHLFRVVVIPGETDALRIRLDRIAQGLHAPTVLTNAADGTNRLFVCEQTGKIFVIENGKILKTPFLDLSKKLAKINPLYDEKGLLGLVFHPNYRNNNRFFVYYSAPKSGSGIDHESILAEYQVSSDPNIADPESEKIILRVDEPEMNHNGGELAFGPDGYLYIGLGDGGGAGDQHGTIGNAQNISVLLGKILRIDVDNGTPYGIPPDNPFVGIDGADEIFAYGFRNPYRFSFDQVAGDLFVADVGQDEWEEIDIVENGGNYGWRILEGNHPYDLALATFLGINISSLKEPIHDYSHDVGHSIIGGYVYRGSALPDLVGKYVFGDWSTGFFVSNGKLFYLDEIQPGVWERVEFKMENDQPLKRSVLSFGVDEMGEIYVCTTKTIGSLFATGEVWEINVV